jgi:hypothetical protein
MVSRNLKDTVERKYLQKVSPMLDFTGFRRNPPEDLKLFSVLKPRESYSTSTDSRVDLLVGHDREAVRPGKYLLQVRVITWYYHPEDTNDRLRVQWQDHGFLWTNDVTSEPMIFEVESKPPTQLCSIHS